MKKILITGASGFIGSFLVEESLRRGMKVFAGIRSTSSKKYLLDARIQFLEMDLSDEKMMTQQFEEQQFDYIIHAAGLTKANNKKEYFTVNTEGSNNLVNALKQSQSVPEKFIFLSSLAAYGPADNHAGEQVELHHQPFPITTYGKSKLQAEQHLQRQNNLPFLIFRPTAVYGPKETDLFIFFNLINRGLEAYIGNKPQKLTFVYVKDLVNLILDALPSSVVQRDYFVADGRTYSTPELGELTKGFLGKSTLKMKIPTSIIRAAAFSLEKMMLPFGKYPTLNLEKVNELESLNWQCNIEPLIEYFDFKPQYFLEKGLEETLQWYRENGWF